MTLIAHDHFCRIECIKLGNVNSAGIVVQYFDIGAGIGTVFIP